MSGTVRANIHNREGAFVLIYLHAWELTFDDFTEYAVVHFLPLFVSYDSFMCRAHLIGSFALLF